MTNSLDELQAKVLQLPPDDRARLAEVLIESLDEEVEDDGRIRKAWREEISRRLTEVREGTVETIPWEQVREELDDLLD